MAVDKLAQKVIDAYAHDKDGLTHEECEGLGLNKNQADVLCSALGNGAAGMVTEDESKALRSAGFGAEFIQGIAGNDGNKALHERVKWLGEHIVTKSWRNDFYPAEREDFANELKDMGSEAQAAMPWLAEELGVSDRDEREVQKAVINVLGAIGPDTPGIKQALIMEVTKYPYARSSAIAAAFALGSFGSKAKEAVPFLAEAISKDLSYYNNCYWIENGQLYTEIIDWNSSPSMFEEAVKAIGKMGPDGKDAIPVLMKAAYEAGEYRNDVSSSNIPQRKPGVVFPVTSWALAQIGSAAVPALTKALKDENSQIQRWAAQTLSMINS